MECKGKRSIPEQLQLVDYAQKEIQVPKKIKRNLKQSKTSTGKLEKAFVDAE